MQASRRRSSGGGRNVQFDNGEGVAQAGASSDAKGTAKEAEPTTAEELEEGEVSEVVESPLGLHLIRLEERRIQSFDDVAEDYRAFVQEQRSITAESTFIASLEEVSAPSVTEGAFDVARELARSPETRLSRRAGQRSLVEWPDGAYTVVLMIWGSDQGTPLHDHSGMWCVECVCVGSITVDSYDRLPNRCSGSGLWDFKKVDTVQASVGEAGALIPPFDYHTIHNHGDTTSATIHIYCGELTECSIFVPKGSGYQHEVRPLTYSD